MRIKLPCYSSNTAPPTPHDEPSSTTYYQAVILANTVCMALEGVCEFEADAYCADLKGVLEVLNVVFTCVFLVEFLVKVAGLGPLEYAQVMSSGSGYSSSSGCGSG